MIHGQRLLPLLIDRFPGSSHVRLIGLGGASDSAIWEWAKQERLLLVTKDEDFLDLSVARGFPPTAALLLQKAETIDQFAQHPEAGFLLLRPEPTGS